MPVIAVILIALATCAVGAGAGFMYRKQVTEQKIGRAEQYATDLLNDATRKAEEQRKEKILEAKEEVLRLKTDLDREIHDRRAEQQRSERRVAQREETLDKKMDNLEKREERINQKSEEIQAALDEAERLKNMQSTELERIAGITADEATQIIISRVQKEAYHDAAAFVRDIELKAREEGDKKARNIIASAIQRCASDHVAESTVSVISLPNDDMKGRIIGREGRNIRAIEAARSFARVSRLWSDARKGCCVVFCSGIRYFPSSPRSFAFSAALAISVSVSPSSRALSSTTRAAAFEPARIFWRNSFVSFECSLFSSRSFALSSSRR